MFQLKRSFSTGLVSLFLLTAPACESGNADEGHVPLEDTNSVADTAPPDTSQPTPAPDTTAPNPTASTCAQLAASMGIPSDLDTPQTYEVVSTYADLPIAETWAFEADLDIRTLAPEFVVLHGQNRMYTPRPPNGIAHYVNPSGDGITWTNEAVAIPQGEGGIHGHPYGATAPDGTFYLFMQTAEEIESDESTEPKEPIEPPEPTDPQGPKPQGHHKSFTVSVATTTDGENFTSPDTAFDCTKEGLEQCAHGRITQLDNGCYLMAVSASAYRKQYKPVPWIHDDKPQNPTYIPGNILALSDDLETWHFTGTYFRACHDPSFGKADGRLSIYCHNESTNSVLRFDSTNGLDFDPLSPAGRVDLLAPTGESMTDHGPELLLGFGDVEWQEWPGLDERFYASVNKNMGIHGQVTPTIWSFTLISRDE